jgi:hypothetical protein
MNKPNKQCHHINGYYQVDDILDRRMKKYGSESSGGVRHVVEHREFCYCIQNWFSIAKIPRWIILLQ